mgnify:CR=1 FL=1
MTRNEALAWKPTKKWSDETKLSAFDNLRDMALDHVASIQKDVAAEDYCDDSDAEHYIYEAVMELLGKDVWKAVNALAG